MAASASAPLLHDRPPAYNETQGQAAGYYPPAAGAVGPGHPMPPPGYAQPPAGSAGYGPPPPAGAAGVVPKHPVPPYGGQYPGIYVFFVGFSSLESYYINLEMLIVFCRFFHR